jgi:two-component sensor histidine kinase
LEEFQDAFDGRMNALSRAHDLLLTAPDRPVSLRELLALEFDAKGLSEGTLFQLMGPDVLCDPRTIQTLALVIFELSTNAVKYGALSPAASSSAGIRVHWSIQESAEHKTILLVWREWGVTMPAMKRRGFGSELIERLVPDMLNGSTRLTPHDDGMECEITFRCIDV